MLRKLTAAALIGAVALTISLPASAYYHMPIPPPPPPPPPPPQVHSTGTSGAAGAAAVTGFIGFVSAIVTYDLIRRTTCSGDFLGLGGPGFTEKMPIGNVMIPQCPVRRAKVVRVRGGEPERLIKVTRPPKGGLSFLKLSRQSPSRLRRQYTSNWRTP